MTLCPRDHCPFRTDNALCDFAEECMEHIKTMGKRKAKQYAIEHYPICVFDSPKVAQEKYK